MIHVGIPVVDNHELTEDAIKHLTSAAVGPVSVMVIDNDSDQKYDIRKLRRIAPDTEINLIRNRENRGYYYPLLQMRAQLLHTHADIWALMHNDLFIYEEGWDSRLIQSFVSKGDLGMVGFCGSDEVDDRGGRGGGTMCNFRGARGALTEHTGRRETGLHPACIFDSLFLAMRDRVVDCLAVDENIALNHFGDRVWPLRAIEHSWDCAVLGIEVDHMSGQTCIGIEKIEDDSKKWCLQHGVELQEGVEQYATQVYLESERRYLSEYRDSKHMVPGKMRGWQFVAGA